MFFPNEWKALLEHRSDPKASVVASYHSLVTNQDNPWGQRVTAARAWLTWDCLGSSLSSPGEVDLFYPQNIMLDALTVFNKGGSLDMTDEEAIATASIGLQLYTEVPIRSSRIYNPTCFFEPGKKPSFVLLSLRYKSSSTGAHGPKVQV